MINNTAASIATAEYPSSKTGGFAKPTVRFSPRADAARNKSSEMPVADRSSWDDAGSGLFEPDIILPSHFLSNKGRGLSGGERRLMAAILSDGIESYVAQNTSESQPARRRKNHIDASEWVETRDFSYVFSFDNVCECLGINPEYLRLGLARYVASVHLAQRNGQVPKRVWKKIRRPRKKF